MQEIICVLDKSGSMQSVFNDAVGGFNAFLQDQQKEGEAGFTLIWFDNSPITEYQGPLSKAKQIEKWPNGGCTALLDAIGYAFTNTAQRFEKEKPEKVILAILTDGLENASKQHTTDSVAELIKHHQEVYGWEVIFLAADQDAWATAQKLNIKRGDTYSYSSFNTASGICGMSVAVTEKRKSNG